MDWDDWWEKYQEVFEEIAGVGPPDDDLASTAYDRGFSPEAAARMDARFMMFGE